MTIKTLWTKLAVEDLDKFESEFQRAENKERAHRPIRKFRK